MTHARPPIPTTLGRLLALWTCLLPVAHADNCPSVSPYGAWTYYYDGAIASGEHARMTLRFMPSGQVQGRWVDTRTLADLAVTGRLSGDRTVAVLLSDDQGQAVASLDGRFLTRDPEGLLSTDEDLGCDVLSGHLHPIAGPALAGADSAVEFRVDLLFDGDEPEVDQIAGITDRAAFNRATRQFWMAVRDDDRATVVAAVDFPLTVVIPDTSPKGYHELVLRHAADLLGHYDEVFDVARRRAILEHPPRHLAWSGRSDAIMLGTGLVFFNRQGRVSGL